MWCYNSQCNVQIHNCCNNIFYIHHKVINVLLTLTIAIISRIVIFYFLVYKSLQLNIYNSKLIYITLYIYILTWLCYNSNVYTPYDKV